MQLNCAPTNLTCLCSAEFATVVEPCIEHTCSVREALTATKISADICGLPNPNGGKVLEIIPPICGGLATLFITLRLAGKFLHGQRPRIEDGFAVASWVGTISSSQRLQLRSWSQKLTLILPADATCRLFHRHSE